ncbi:MAG: hypothetical protein HY648_02075 [Acidobacteria bacterium]|nr:hypothetical protein [Acidobacteriota bacterium]
MPNPTQTKKRPLGARMGRGKRKISSSSLHGHAVAVSVNERLEDLSQRYPALSFRLQPLRLQGKKRIRDLPVVEQEKLLRTVFALKKTSGG